MSTVRYEEEQKARSERRGKIKEWVNWLEGQAHEAKAEMGGKGKPKSASKFAGRPKKEHRAKK